MAIIGYYGTTVERKNGDLKDVVIVFPVDAGWRPQHRDSGGPYEVHEGDEFAPEYRRMVEERRRQLEAALNYRGRKTQKG